MLKIITLSAVIATTLMAESSCSDVKDLKQHNGHYYGISNKKMTFNNAKKFAEQKGGYLAIPNSAAENAFLKSILGGRNGGWLGIYDPSDSSDYSFYVGEKVNASRFKTIQDSALTYSNWQPTQPDNFVHEYDVFQGTQRVAPLGENWVAMDGNSGRWWDHGNHYTDGDALFYALMEFDTMPSCFEDLSSNVTDVIEGMKCTTQIWDDRTGNLETGSVFDCEEDKYGNTYCPSAVAPCAQEWDYDDGFSVPGVGQVVDYTGIRDWEPGPTFKTPTGIEYFKAVENVLYNEAVGLCSSLGARLPTYLETSNYNSNGVPPYKESSSSWTSDVDTQSSRTYHRVWNSTSSSWVMTKYLISDYQHLNTNEKRDVVCVTGNQPQQIKKAQNGLYYFNLNASLTYHEASNACNSYGGGFRLPKLNETRAGNSNGVPSFNNQFTWTSNYQLRDYGGCGPVPHTHWYLSYKDNTTKWIQVTTQCNGYHNTNTRAATICVTQNKPEALTKCPQGYTETTGTEAAKGKCKKTIQYTYYNYLCNSSPNAQGYDYIPQNLGGDCKKTDTSGTANNSADLAKPCNTPNPPATNCKREKYMCQANRDRPCSFVDNKWQCSPFPCYGEKDTEIEGDVEGANDKNNNGWGEDGMCNGQIYIFNGKDRRCRSSDTFGGLAGGGCCNKDKVFLGLIQCKENEKLLAKQNKSELCTEIGEYCSKKLNLGFTKICIQKSKGFCCFGTKLSRFVHEQGRGQIGLSWGSAESPNCRGFTPEEFQKLDFSKINLEGAFDMPEVTPAQLNGAIDTAVNNFKNMIQNGN
ncbi:MAG: conjugal transfer protein TraN [Sulfurimonadaceae bacterium]|jgi:conjugal transfer mating pair stabilization protein TraN|nr:conjugal transfer protein TraN [Sulfurimonadaceae bacterium]